jgi:chromosome segregation ATPase
MLALAKQDVGELQTMRHGGINPVWSLLVAAIAVVGTLFVSYKMFKTQQRVEAVQTELERTKIRGLELEEHAARLSFQREDAVRQRVDIQSRLDEATSEINELRSKLDQSISAIQNLQNQAVKARSEIDDKQSRLDALQSEVERLSNAMDQANTKAENAIAKRDELQRKLDQANSQIERR